ncbi:MAG TPA: hypothetical protein VHO02_07660, partial [Fibrobacteria bacterium]|nr:hypothetical protein [Fibrobacteria bacterium]
MKGFPNQISDIQKLTEVLLAFHELVVAGKNIHDEAVVGEALVRKELIGGRGKMSPEEYLKSQLKKTRSNQSYRATARGLNELFRILGLVEGDGVSNLTTLGTSIVEAAKSRSREEIIAFWKPAIHTLGHRDKDGFQSHPYQVLLRLVANHPGINRKMCALALEAKDDSETELQRILKLSHLDEEAAYKAIGVSKSN